MDGHDLQSTLLAHDALTWRERDILALLAQGFSDREIAHRLIISLNTVKWYNRQIFDKLRVKNRHQAVERASALTVADTQPFAAPLHNLPVQTTPFIGRVGELENLTRLLSNGPTRLITLLAPGGMGKTRLALAVAETCLLQFADGVYFVSLAPLASLDQLLPAIAEAIGLQLTPDHRNPKQQVLKLLYSKQILLVLDNFEHLVDGAALLSELLEAAPRLRLLVTSRERLNLSCETLYALWGMGYPESPQTENARDYSAVQLFLECGRRLAPRTVLEDTTSIIQVCKLTQGMPLAIELAGAWLVALSPAEIAAEIERSLDFLQTTMHDIPERQRSIRAVFEASWQHLSETEQAVFRKLSVFQGGFTREAVQMVAESGTDSLIGLLNKALISYSLGRERYEVHELLRQFADDKLELCGETKATLRRHALYFAGFLSARLSALQGRVQQKALHEIESDFDNLREAVHYLLDFDETDYFMSVLESLRLFFEAWVQLSSAVHHPGLPYISLRLIFEAQSHFNADAAALFTKAAIKVQAAEARVSIHEGLGDSLQVLGAYHQARLEFEQAKQLLQSTAFVPRARLLRKEARTLDAERRFEDALQLLAVARETLASSGERDEVWQQEWMAVQNDIISAYFFLGRLPPFLEQKADLRAIVKRIEDQFSALNSSSVPI